jgi:hypothetical protein
MFTDVSEECTASIFRGAETNYSSPCSYWFAFVLLFWPILEISRVEAGSNTSTVTPLFVGNEEISLESETVSGTRIRK